MTTKLTWLGHSTWLIETAEHRILVDPFLTENPAATMKPSDLNPVSHILITHGHFDHIADAAEIAKKHGAMIVAIYETATWFANNHGVESTLGMNLGGATDLPFGTVKMVPALHSNGLPDGSYGGDPAGFVVTIDGKRIYLAGDTAIFSDMKLHAHGVDVAVLPMGDLFTMGVDDSVAATKLIEPKTVLPTHYNTWPPIEQDAGEWAEKIQSQTNAAAKVLAVGESFEL